jgi:hypothetical protein
MAMNIVEFYQAINCVSVELKTISETIPVSITISVSDPYDRDRASI